MGVLQGICFEMFTRARLANISPNNVCAVQCRLFNTVETVLYGRGLTLVLWRAKISTVEAVQCGGGLTSVQWRASVSTMEAAQYGGGLNLWDIFSMFLDGYCGLSSSGWKLSKINGWKFKSFLLKATSKKTSSPARSFDKYLETFKVSIDAAHETSFRHYILTRYILQRT